MVGVLVAWTLYHPDAIGVPRTSTSYVARVATAPVATASVLWVLSIGVSHYQRADLNLQFAALDARAVAGAFATQTEGPLYREVKTLVLTDDEVTREAILDSMGRFLGQAGANDIAVIFLAGHGVQDRASGGYYFLPSATTADNLITTGLRMSDFEAVLQVVRHKARAVIVMMDTCHAGALQLASPAMAPMDEPAARLAAGEGLFLIGATKPGEQSQESPELAHGAFTYALLEGLQGAADADKDGLLSVSDLFGYVAREVPRLTGGQQHPYHRMEGTDVVFAAVTSKTEPIARERAVAEQIAAPTAAPAENTIAVMEFRNVRANAEDAWIGTALRLAFNTELSKVRALNVYAPELIDRTTAQRAGTDQLSIAQQLGIHRLITGSFSIVGNAILIDARIVDASTGLQEGSGSVQGDLTEFLSLQKTLVLNLLRRLRVRVSAEEGSSIQDPTNTDVNAYRLLLQTEEELEEPSAQKTRRPTSGSSTPGPQSRRDTQSFTLIGAAYAAEPEEDAEREVRELLQQYRQALEHKDLEGLAELYVAFSPSRRDALREYFDNAGEFAVELANVTVTPHGSEMTVSYTRRDRFIDKGTGKRVSLEVRLTRLVVREGGKWKIAGRP